MANKYLDLTGLSDFATKLLAKLKTIFATKTDVGAPLLAETVADMTDEDRIYVYVGSETGYTNGNWYYWDGTAWASGGTYNSQGIGDGEITTAKLADGAVTSAKIASGAVVNSVNGRTGAVTGVAEEDGYYEEMSVGGAEQLLSNMYETDAVPYKFRTSGGSLEIGDREYDEIVGGSLVWNQLNRNPNFTSDERYSALRGTIAVSDNACILTATSDEPALLYVDTSNTTIHPLKGQKLLVCADVTTSENGTISPRVVLRDSSTQLAFINVSDFVANVKTRVSVIFDVPSDITRTRFDIYTGTTEGSTAKFENFMFFNLTQMFGSTTIADYIYTLEQANAGAGVAWVQKYIGTGYHPYSANTLTHIEGLSAHEMTGFNQWDEEWEVGGIDANGDNSSSNSTIRAKNKFRVVPSTSYYFFCGASGVGSPFYIFYYDASEAFIGSSGGWMTNGAYTTPSNAQYCRFQVRSSYGTTYNHDICINFHWDGERDGEYEPYEKRTYALDDSLVLRGIPKQDESGNLYFDGDRYRSDGTVERRYAEVDLGSLNWVYDTTTVVGTPFFMSGNIVGRLVGDGDNIRCSRYIAVGARANLANGDKTMSRFNPSSNNICVRDDAYTDATAFKTAMNGVYLLYEVDTPTTESAEPFTSPQWVNNWGTEEYVSTTIVPVGHETRYIPDLKAKLETMADSPSGNGTYVLQQTSGINEYVPLVIPNELPTLPSGEDGTYLLKATVASGTTTLSWEAQT